MKEKIISALKTKFPGVSADIIDRIAGMLAKTTTTEEQVATAVEGVTEELISVIEGYGDSRATGAQKTAVLNYERKYGLKEGVKVKDDTKTDDDPPKGNDDQTPAWAKALIDSNKQLTERLNKMEGERITESRTAELNGIIDRLPENLRRGYQRISVDSLTDEEFETLKGEVTSEVEELVKVSDAKSAVFGRPTVGNKSVSASSNPAEASDAEASAVVDKLNIF